MQNQEESTQRHIERQRSARKINLPANLRDLIVPEIYQPGRHRKQRSPDEMEHRALLSRIEIENDDPRTVKEAFKSWRHEDWKRAMEEEIRSVTDHNVWTLMPPPPKIRPLTSKWVFRMKKNEKGDVEWYKARIVVRGFEQVEGVDFNETFAPTCKYKSIRTLLAIGATKDLEIHQLDVKTAFLHGTLKEDVYMKQPEGFEDPKHPDWVCKLNKTLYGLKQSPREWYNEIQRVFQEMGLHRTEQDHCVFIGKIKGKTVRIGLYVDDILVLGESIAIVEDVKKLIGDQFDVKDLGEAKLILGMEITRNRKKRTLTVKQTQYIEELLDTFNMKDAKPIRTPMEPGLVLTLPDADTIQQEFETIKNLLYRQLVGCLMYLASASHLEITFAVGILVCTFNSLTLKHWEAAK